MTDLLKREDANWKPKAYVIGGVAGLVLGLLAAYLYARASEETANGPQRINTMDALKLAVALLSVVRQVTDLGASSGKK